MKYCLIAIWLMVVAIPVVGFCEDSVLKTEGQGHAAAYPDVVTIRIHIGAKGETAKTAASETAAKYESVVKSLKPLGFERDDIVTINFFVGEYQDRDPNTRKIVEEGYHAKHNIEVKCLDFKMIGDIVDRTIQNGGTKITRIHFSSTKMGELQLEALEKAVKRAHKKATIMATTVGGKLGQLIEMSTGRPMRAVPVAAASEGTGQATSVPTTMIPPMLRVSAKVEVKWEYLPEGQ